MTKPAFSPHAIIICERSVPTSPTFAAILGIDNLLKLSLDQSQGEHTYLQQALDGLEARLAKYENDSWKRKIPYFDRPTSIVLNYSEIHAIRYDMDGNVIETLSVPVLIGSGAATTEREKISLLVS